MVVEYIHYRIPAEQAETFADAYRRAAVLLEADPHCQKFEMSHGVEEPENWVVRIEWDFIEGHEQGFRRSPGFRDFFAEVRPYFGGILEMKHAHVLPANE